VKTTSLITGLVGATAISIASISFAATAAFSTAQVSAMKTIIHNYIVNNPQVLVEASDKLRKQAAAKTETSSNKAIIANAQQLFNDAASPVGGNPKGDITLVEFFDYQCGHCKAMQPIVEKIIANNKNLRVVYKELPIFGGVSTYASKVALAAMNQHRYQAFHDALMVSEPPLTEDKVMDTAKKVGLNMTTLKKDMNSAAVKANIKSDFDLAQDLQLVGTPAFIVSNKGQTKIKFIPGATSQKGLEQAIESVGN
jgi:protein-disulfide isomerase